MAARVLPNVQRFLDPADSHRPRTVIIGGLSAAAGLKRLDADVRIVDRRNHHPFQPLLYQVATAALSPVDIADQWST